jgi:hypothetical protein
MVIEGQAFQVPVVKPKTHALQDATSKSRPHASRTPPGGGDSPESSTTPKDPLYQSYNKEWLVNTAR